MRLLSYLVGVPLKGCSLASPRPPGQVMPRGPISAPQHSFADPGSGIPSFDLGSSKCCPLRRRRRGSLSLLTRHGDSHSPWHLFLCAILRAGFLLFHTASGSMTGVVSAVWASVSVPPPCSPRNMPCEDSSQRLSIRIVPAQSLTDPCLIDALHGL